MPGASSRYARSREKGSRSRIEPFHGESSSRSAREIHLERPCARGVDEVLHSRIRQTVRGLRQCIPGRHRRQIHPLGLLERVTHRPPHIFQNLWRRQTKSP